MSWLSLHPLLFPPLSLILFYFFFRIGPLRNVIPFCGNTQSKLIHISTLWWRRPTFPVTVQRKRTQQRWRDWRKRRGGACLILGECIHPLSPPSASVHLISVDTVCCRVWTYLLWQTHAHTLSHHGVHMTDVPKEHIIRKLQCVIIHSKCCGQSNKAGSRRKITSYF